MGYDYGLGEVEREEGFEKRLEKVALNALAEGASIEFVSKITMLNMDKVRELSYTIQARPVRASIIFPIAHGVPCTVLTPIQYIKLHFL